MSVPVPSAPLQSSRTTLNRVHKLYCMDRLYKHYAQHDVTVFVLSPPCSLLVLSIAEEER
jgi:hypothetical protein